MINILKTIPLAIFFFLSICPISIAGQFKVTKVYDGDTVKAEGHDIEIKVRPVGIDTPIRERPSKGPIEHITLGEIKYKTPPGRLFLCRPAISTDGGRQCL